MKTPEQAENKPMLEIAEKAVTSVETPKPKIHIDWIRFPHDEAANLKSALKRPSAFAIYGGRGEGKSALTENLANNYRCIVDLFGSRDLEGLAWCRSPRKDAILFLKGASANVSSNWDCKNAIEFKLKDIEDYKVILTCSAFYSEMKEEWYSLERIMKVLWKRTHWQGTPDCLVIREASNLIYSRVSIGENQNEAKNYAIYVIREMRHSGFALCLDSLRWFSIDIDTRTLADYTFLKAQGIEGLPQNLHFVYQYLDAYGVMRMGVEKFAVLSRKGPIGAGWADYPPWHKTEKEDLLKLFNIQVEFGEAINMGDRNVNQTTSVGDFEHVKIIKSRAEPTDTGHPKSMMKLAEELNRSSRTIMLHLNYHNDAVTRDGECPRCRRTKCELSKVAVS